MGLWLLVLTGSAHCRLFGPHVELDEATRPLPTEYPNKDKDGGQEADLDRYWELFDADDLNTLVDGALAENYSLKAAAARVRGAGFGARVAWSDRFPSFSYEATLARTERRSTAVTQERAPGWTMQLGVAGRYEVNLWGRAYAVHESELARFEAARWDYATVRMTLVSELVLRWIDVRAANVQLALLEDQAETIERSTKLTELRYKQGNAAWTDVLALRQTMSAIGERRAVMRQLKAGAVAELRLLTGGREPKVDSSPKMPPVPSLPSAGLPADLVTQRPDVQAAWQRGLAAGWSVSVKEAERLPSLQLFGSFAFAAENPDALFNSWIASFVAGISGPLFDFFGRRYAADQAEANANALMAELSGTLLGSFRDVETALSANRQLKERLEAVRERASIAKTRAKQLEVRYRNGAAGYLNLYLAELDRMEAERAEVTAQADLLRQRVQLARALGGGWMHEGEGDDVIASAEDEEAK